jgi:hypothetical protein
MTIILMKYDCKITLHFHTTIKTSYHIERLVFWKWLQKINTNKMFISILSMTWSKCFFVGWQKHFLKVTQSKVMLSHASSQNNILVWKIYVSSLLSESNQILFKCLCADMYKYNVYWFLDCENIRSRSYRKWIPFIL